MKPRPGNHHRRGKSPRSPAPAPHPARPEQPGVEAPALFVPSLPQLVTVEKPIYGGNFLGRLEGKAVFVPLLLPGERARVRIVDEKRGYATAEAEEILTAAPERTAPLCPHFGACGGCQYQHAAYEAQLRMKQAILRETLERGGVRAPEQIEVLAGQPWAYRNRIRLAFDRQGNPGYRGRRSHAIVPITACPIAAPALVQTALAAADKFKRLDAASRPAELSLFSDAAGGSVIASLFTVAPLRKQYAALLEQIPALLGAEVIELRPNAPPRTVARQGAGAILYHAAGFALRVDHGAFFQVNRFLVDPLVERVAAHRRGQLAWDLFAGVGLFARKLAESFATVIAVESAPAATAALAHNLSGTAGVAEAASTLQFLRRSRRGQRPDFVVVDPPRTGLGRDTTALLAERAAPEITYVSCDPATLARDLRDLLAAGYEIERVTLVDLFPQTFHLETVVDLKLGSADR